MDAKRDNNSVTTLLGVSSVDGITPVTIYVDPTTHRVLVDLPGGGGDVTGPASSTDNAIVRFNGATGKIIQDYTSNAPTVSDTGTMQIPTLTASEIVGTDASKNVVSLPVATYPSLTELSYGKGVTSSIQDQLDTKAPIADPTFTGEIGIGAVNVNETELGILEGATVTTAELNILDGVTADATEINVLDGITATTAELNILDGVTATATELNYTDGVTSAIQTQLDAKLATTAYDDATAAEVNTGTSTAKYVSPDALAGSYAGSKSLSIQVTAFDGDVATGDSQAIFTIPSYLNGMNLVRAQAVVYTAGTTGATTVMIRNKTDAVDMLSGAISIASGGTVGTVGTINGATDDVATNDLIAIDVDSVSTTAPQGLTVVLEFQLS